MLIIIIHREETVFKSVDFILSITWTGASLGGVTKNAKLWAQQNNAHIFGGRPVIIMLFEPNAFAVARIFWSQKLLQ